MIRKKQCIAMLLGGGQGQPPGRADQPYGQARRALWRQVSHHRFSAFQLRQQRHRHRGRADAVSAPGAQRLYRLGRAVGSGRKQRRRVCAAPLPHRQTGEWYRGTANAIYQNLAFIEQFNPDYVLILSGDHIYKMDYNAMLRHHIQKNADVTIAVRQVPWEEASRFGIMNTDEQGTITEFEEKPAHPKSNNASMGVYIFRWDKLRDYLTRDEQDPASSNDFGKNVIPAMLGDGCRMVAYSFNDYWKDVGTIAKPVGSQYGSAQDPAAH